MRKLILLLITCLVFSCNTGDKASTETLKNDNREEEATPNYPYTIDHPDNWERGSNANTVAALTSLKAWENGNIDETVKYFADTVHVQFDALDATISNDSLKAMFDDSRDRYKTMNIKMSDWESVISKDKAHEWVTIWYRQTWETTKGEKDSVAIINDLEFKNGKIIGLDEYSRKLH